MEKASLSSFAKTPRAASGASGAVADKLSRPRNPAEGDEVFRIENLTMAYGDYVVMRDLNFSVNKG